MRRVCVCVWGGGGVGGGAEGEWGRGEERKGDALMLFFVAVNFDQQTITSLGERNAD